MSSLDDRMKALGGRHRFGSCVVAGYVAGWLAETAQWDPAVATVLGRAVTAAEQSVVFTGPPIDPPARVRDRVLTAVASAAQEQAAS